MGQAVGRQRARRAIRRRSEARLPGCPWTSRHVDLRTQSTHGARSGRGPLAAIRAGRRYARRKSGAPQSVDGDNRKEAALAGGPGRLPPGDGSVPTQTTAHSPRTVQSSQLSPRYTRRKSNIASAVTRVVLAEPRARSGTCGRGSRGDHPPGRIACRPYTPGAVRNLPPRSRRLPRSDRATGGGRLISLVVGSAGQPGARVARLAPRPEVERGACGCGE